MAERAVSSHCSVCDRKVFKRKVLAVMAQWRKCGADLSRNFLAAVVIPLAQFGALRAQWVARAHLNLFF